MHQLIEQVFACLKVWDRALVKSFEIIDLQ